MTAAKKRTTGAYHTDWRLAEYLAGESVRRVAVDGLWVDPACGAGMLLAAAALVVPEGAERDQVIRERLCGMDLSKQALRGALLSVASLSSDLAVASGFRDRLFCLDSLRSREVWQEIAPHGFALVIGNPPWERLKTSRHEVAASSGVVRHYGQSHQTNVDVTAPRAELLKYLEQIVAGTRLQGSGEHDLYKLFLELGLGLAADNGILAMLVPAGLIRAQGTNTLRKELDSLSRDLHISVIENRRRHFAIDTRFKFLAAISRVGQGTKQPISLKVADRAGVLPKIPVRIDRKELCEIRTDLTVPEVRTAEEWRLFAHLSRIGLRIGDPNGPWNPTYSREVDMTNDRNRFHRQRVEGSVAVIEGRHIAQFRSRAKSYQRGEGRAAIWQPQALENAELVPQWFIKLSDVRGNILNRIEKSRIGFCDITGQTNERSLLAARIPAGVVCGNKVPTLAFGSRGPEVEDLFLAVANSFAADWMLRRLITTSVNFFVLSSLPLPPIDVHSSIGRELVKLARLLTASEGSLSADLRQIGEWRARIDACVAVAWGIGPEQMRLMLDDFPLLDRGQPALPGEAQSTITRDSVLLAMSQDGSEEARAARCRVEKAMREGAIPYIPAEFV
ncbi:restriction endonuclease [Mycobacterium sp. E2327]|uniref:Eco57I restriction-modification methylase domain-containing protein n=1 Tax=Mycobacterium sp. E2327 TaxID=1834132 RepID=UPI0012EA26F3|nr:restriction endonuclease [Mycobacterium sp. E2327]